MSELIQDQFVVGMSWSAIVAAGEVEKLARRKALSEKGNWFNFSDGMKGSRYVGAASLPKVKKLAKGEKIYSMARLAGMRHMYGTTFIAVRLPEDGPFAGQVWICGLAEGSPIGGFDQIVSDVEAPARLESFLQKSGMSAGECAIHGDTSGLPDTHSPLTWAELVELPSNPAVAELLPTVLSIMDRLTPKQKALLGLAAVGLVAYIGYEQYVEKQRRELIAQQQAMQVDPVAEWRTVITNWQAARRAPGLEPITVLRRALATVPIQVAGWKLRGLDCSVNGAESAWVCVGQFDRPKDRTAVVTTAQFMRERPQQWIADSRNLDLIGINFRVPLERTQIDLMQVSSLERHMEDTVSALQRSLPAFSSVSLGAFARVEITAPVDPMSGSPLPAPPGLPVPAMAPIVLTGPLRSLDLPDVARLQAVWDSVQIRINHEQPTPSLNASAVTVEAKGNIYAANR